ncbi:hypothetical protein Hesp01_69410 [Herbidospora sp. NBRC 101105]|nr:hypothetical protein Hesp01_69410 [Herbidospora sp. NBRC 101105]
MGLYRASYEGLAPLRQFLDKMWTEPMGLPRRVAQGELRMPDHQQTQGRRTHPTQTSAGLYPRSPLEKPMGAAVQKRRPKALTGEI